MGQTVRQITEIAITGNEHISKEAIQAVVPVKAGTPYSETAAQTAKQAIEKMGYFSSVTAGVENSESGVRLVFNVVENPVIKDVNITGNTAIATDKLKALMRSTVGSVLNTTTLQQDLLAIENTYSEQGYIAIITENFGIDPQTGVLNIPVLEVHVEDIIVTGNKKTKTKVVLREMQLKAGDVFNRKTLFADLQKIYDLDIFDRETAEPYQLKEGSSVGKVIVTLPVKEKKTGEISIGVGYSSQQRLVGTTKVSETNFRGLAQTVHGTWEQSGDNGSSYELGIFEPWLDKDHTSLGLNLYNKLLYRFSSDLFGGGGSVSDYNERHRGGSATLSRPMSKSSRGYFTLRDESVDTDNFTSRISSRGNVGSGTLRWTNSSRDSELDPFMGTYVSASAELGRAHTQTLTGDFENEIFTKYSMDLRSYLSKGGRRKELNERRARIALRVMGGTLAGNVPFFEQYFMGGAETLRGYREDRFWGKNMFLASIEPRIPLAANLDAVLFVDVGAAWGASDVFRNPNNPDAANDATLQKLLTELPQSSGFSPKIGYGPGIRVMTPLGQLRLDYGFGSEGSRAHFSFGHTF
jgi:outer membrane protein insertion porin family